MIDEQKLREAFEAWALEYHEQLPIWTGTRYHGDVWEDLWLAFQAGRATILALLDELATLRSERTALLVNEQNLRGELEECQAQRRAAFRRIEDQDAELEVTKAAMGDPVAAIRSMYGDPESFGEREIVPLRDIQKLRYDTKLYALANKETK